MRCNVFLLLAFTLTASYAQSPSGPVEVSFFMVGKTIFVEAVLDGKPGNFILDTGAPRLFLNSAYYDGMKIPWLRDEVIDVNGKTCEVLHYIVKDLRISDFPLEDNYAMITDLQGLEASKGIPIAGILGYPSFKNMEILFDFEKNQLLLFPLDRKGRKKSYSADYKPVDSLEMKMSGHFPCIMARLSGKILRLGLDSGAEVNIIDLQVFEGKPLPAKAGSPLVVLGMKNEKKTCVQGKISGLKIGHWNIEPTVVVLADLSVLNEQLRINLDGMLGTPFFMRGKMAINYRQKKLYLWESVEDILSEKRDIADTQNTLNGLK